MRQPRIVGIIAIALFGGDEFVASRNRREFIVTNSAEGDFLSAGIRIEAPGAVCRNQRYREWPVLGADIKGHRSVGLATQAMHLLVFLDEHFAVELILPSITRARDFRRSSKNVHYGLSIVALQRLQ